MQAAEIIGISDRSMRRWKQRYEEYGYDGLFDRRTKKPSPKKVPLAEVEKILRLYRERYFDFNVRHFVEKLHTEHGVHSSYTWVKTALQTAGLVAKTRKRGKHRKKRPRRPLTGMMLHVDGSTHAWLGGSVRQDLVAILDDATSEVYYAQLVDEEGTATVMAGLKEVVEQKGVFCSLYSDRGSHFFYTPIAGGPPDRSRKTQIARALEQLGIEAIPANSPQASAVSDFSARGKAGCLRNCGQEKSPPWQQRMSFSARNGFRTTTETSPLPLNKSGQHSFLMPVRI